MRNYIDRRVTPPKRVTSPTWGPPPQCKQALTWGPPPPCKEALSYELELGHVHANRDIFEPAYIFVTQIPLNGALFEKTRKSNCLFCRQHFLLSYSKTLGVGPTGVRTCEVPLSRPALSQLSQPGGSTVMYSICTAVNSSAERCMHGSL